MPEMEMVWPSQRYSPLKNFMSHPGWQDADFMCLHRAKTVFKHKIIMIRCTSRGWEHFLELKEGRHCQKRIINNPLPPVPSYCRGSRPWSHSSHLARAQIGLINSFAFSAASRFFRIEKMCFCFLLSPGFRAKAEALWSLRMSEKGRRSI